MRPVLVVLLTLAFASATAPAWSAPVPGVPRGSPDLTVAMSHSGEFTVAGQGV